MQQMDVLSAGTLNVFTDGAGNYIDADYNLGKIKVTTTASGVSDKSVYIDNTDDTYDAAKYWYSICNRNANATVIGQDKDYIYRIAKVTVTTTSSAATISAIDGKPVTVLVKQRHLLFQVTNGFHLMLFKKYQKHNLLAILVEQNMLKQYLLI